jgi:hypothetical protein
MKTELSREIMIKSMEKIFENTKRIHGNSEAIDWIKVAIHKSASYILSELCDTKESDIIKALSGEPIEDIPSFTSTDYPDEPKSDINTTKDLIIAKQRERMIELIQMLLTDHMALKLAYAPDEEISSFVKELESELSELKEQSKETNTK